MSTDYALIGVLQNTVTSALFTDGINHSLAELEIPVESDPSSLLIGCIDQTPTPPPPGPSPRRLLSARMLTVLDRTALST